MYPPGYVAPQPVQPVSMGIGTGFKFGLGSAIASIMIAVPIVLVFYMIGYAVSGPTVSTAGLALPMVSMTAR